jgi:hypothetical protein
MRGSLFFVTPCHSLGLTGTQLFWSVIAWVDGLDFCPNQPWRKCICFCSLRWRRLLESWPQFIGDGALILQEVMQKCCILVVVRAGSPLGRSQKLWVLCV